MSQYMSLLKGSSAFSFNPGGGDKEEGGGGGAGGGFLDGLLGQEGEEDGDEDLSLAMDEEREDDEDLAMDMDEVAQTASSSSSFSDFVRRSLSAASPSPLASSSSSSASAPTTAMGDYGGDYGDYLKLLEDDTALGFNPQADPITDNQVGQRNLQTISNCTWVTSRHLFRICRLMCLVAA